MAKLSIAIDGPGSSGKGTVARAVAKALGYQYVDTGSMYRSIALLCTERGIELSDEAAVGEVARSLRFEFRFEGDQFQVFVEGRDVSSAIRQPVYGRGASQVSRYRAVRDALTTFQKALGVSGGVVMDGRDIGTVVLPCADLKIYLDASLEVRAQRRMQDLKKRGIELPLQEVSQQLRRRDQQDMTRALAPLRRAEDAVLVDSTHMSIPAAVDKVVELARGRGA